MILGSKQRLNIYRNDCIRITYNGAEISQCSSIKCLGVIIDRHLLWHDQVDSVCKKIFAGLAMLKRIRPFVENDTLKLLYMCLIESQMNYCCEIWGDRFQIHVDRITKLQKRAARLILRCHIYTPSKEMFSNLDWTAFRYKIIYFRYIFVYKCVHGLAPEYYSNYFHDLSKTHSKCTRQSSRHDLVVPRCRSEYCKHSLFYACPKLWNNLPVTIRELPSLNSFKYNLKKHIRSIDN